MTSGKGPAGTASARALRRHRLRVRTVAVSFAAAARSAHLDLHVAAVQRDALIETWRAWALRQLDGYERDALDLVAAAGPGDTAERDALIDELARGRRMIREA